MKFRTILFILFVLAPNQLFAVTIDFSRSLKVGMSGDDVKALQVAMNRDPETRVSEVGAGSPGNETSYFGSATKHAVIKFQEKYRAEILTPVGLTVGSGFFGEKTRNKLTELYGVTKNIGNISAPLSTTTISILPTHLSSAEQEILYVMRLSQYSGKAGTTITILGGGFTSTDNTVYFGDEHKVEKLLSQTGKVITIKVPDIPKGVYHLWVKNSDGESDRDAFFAVTDGVTPAPIIKSISPTRGPANTIVTLLGTGFAQTGNMLRTSTYVFENVAGSGGTTITIPMKTHFNEQIFLDVSTMDAAEQNGNKLGISIPVHILLVNENGISEGVIFTLDL